MPISSVLTCLIQNLMPLLWLVIWLRYLSTSFVNCFWCRRNLRGLLLLDYMPVCRNMTWNLLNNAKLFSDTRCSEHKLKTKTVLHVLAGNFSVLWGRDGMKSSAFVNTIKMWGLTPDGAFNLFQADNAVDLHHVICGHGGIYFYFRSMPHLGGLCDCRCVGVS